ncbi:MAG TPA: DNA polymerase III subunit beta [Candidatus Berkiella sp.]|nr:DNA polymerase III subunit beta [Candidatus Berkiella sp.]
MQFTISREALLKPLLRVAGAVEKRQTLPILANILVSVKNQLLSLTGTDLEIEMIARIPLTQGSMGGTTTIPGKKLIDICKALPDSAQISFELTDNKVAVRANRSRFVLACMPGENFPRVEEMPGDIELSVGQAVIRQLLDLSSFAMAHQDVRYYLNGVYLIFSTDEIRAVATDGHRLATMALPIKAPHLSENLAVIVPRKAILEMQRLFQEGEEEIGLVIGKNHLRAVMMHSSFITKLIEGKFPDYRRVMPTNAGYQVVVAREPLRQALLRVSALFSDKFRGVGLQFSSQLLRIVAVTADKDEVEDEVEIPYDGPSMEIGVNASYIIEFLSIIKTEQVKITFSDPSQVVLFETQEQGIDRVGLQYVVMPMRL